eukprot:COSAG01_NODE_2506_length_7552_cov_66.389776_1_plen_87_part_10
MCGCTITHVYKQTSHLTSVLLMRGAGIGHAYIRAWLCFCARRDAYIGCSSVQLWHCAATSIARYPAKLCDAEIPFRITTMTSSDQLR